MSDEEEGFKYGMVCPFCGDYWKFKKLAHAEAMKFDGCVICAKARKHGGVYGIARAKHEQ